MDDVTAGTYWGSPHCVTTLDHCSDVPVQLQLMLSKFLEAGKSVYLVRSDDCKSGWRVGCAECEEARRKFHAVTVISGGHFNAVNLENHINAYHPQVSTCVL